MDERHVIRGLVGTAGLLALLFTLAGWAASSGVGLGRAYEFESVGRFFYSRCIYGQIDWFSTVNPQAPKGLTLNRVESRLVVPFASRLGFHLPRWGGFNGPVKHVRIPLWILSVIAMVTVLVAWRPFIRWPRKGYCRACGYNLRGNLSGRCPECGRQVREFADRHAATEQGLRANAGNLTTQR